MTLNPENKPPEAELKIKNDTNLTQQNSAANLAQQTAEDAKKTEQEQSDAEAMLDPNWRSFREARKKDREAKNEAIRRAEEKEQEIAALKAAMEAAFAKSAPSTQAYQQYYGMNEQPEETEEQRIERKVNEMLSKKEQQFKLEQQEFEKREYPNRLRRDFPDFAQVCSQENLDYLDYHYPEISRPLQRLGDGYDKWHDTYHAVKKLIPNHATAKKDAVRADINANKPKSMSTLAQSTPGRATAETWREAEERRAANWERMQRQMKGV